MGMVCFDRRQLTSATIASWHSVNCLTSSFSNLNNVLIVPIRSVLGSHVDLVHTYLHQIQEDHFVPLDDLSGKGTIGNCWAKQVHARHMLTVVSNTRGFLDLFHDPIQHIFSFWRLILRRHRVWS